MPDQKKKIETQILDFEEAKGIQSELKLPWLMWDAVVITSQMKRLNITEIYANDEDLQNLMDQKNILKTSTNRHPNSSVVIHKIPASSSENPS